MKSPILCATALAAAALAGAASAQDSGSITIQSSVGPYCTALPISGSTLQLGELADANGRVRDEFQGFVGTYIPTYWCNAPTTVTLATTPLMNTQTPVVTDPASFTNRVDYTAKWEWGSLSRTKSSAAGDDTSLVATANTGQLVVSAYSPFTESDKRPVAGAYVGTVTLTVVPQ